MKKTIETLATLTVVAANAEPVVFQVVNPCQMWRKLNEVRTEFPTAERIDVARADGTLYKSFTYKTLKNGNVILTNSVKETNRGMMAKAKKAALAAQTKEAEKKAKKAAYDKARRERIRAEKAAKAAAEA